MHFSLQFFLQMFFANFFADCLQICLHKCFQKICQNLQKNGQKSAKKKLAKNLQKKSAKICKKPANNSAQKICKYFQYTILQILNRLISSVSRQPAELGNWNISPASQFPNTSPSTQPFSPTLRSTPKFMTICSASQSTK